MVKIVQQFDLTQSWISSTNFNHLLISNNFPGEKLHIYIEGDGVPWVNRYTMSKDPTPENPLALKLMSQDTNKAIYIGRPCYFGSYASEGCTITQWTNGRYGKEVIESMQNAISSYVDNHQIEKIILIGYSGGGVLASLLADNIEQTEFYLTIAANLDIDAWTDFHNYSRLDKSINPAELSNKRRAPAVHLIGQKDFNVPYHLNQQFIKRTKATSIVLPNFNHVCCWEENWNDRLIKIKKQFFNTSFN